MSLRENIRRALNTPCHYDFMAVHRVLAAEEAWPEHRKAFARLIELVGLLASKQPANARTLAAKFHTSTKTISRDIDFLRNRLGAQINYVRDRWTYELVGEFKFSTQLKGTR